MRTITGAEHHLIKDNYDYATITSINNRQFKTDKLLQEDIIKSTVLNTIA